jgi:hypothetical protein
MPLTGIAVMLPLALMTVQTGAPVFSADAEPPAGKLEIGDAKVELRDAPTPTAEVIATATRESAGDVSLVRVRVVTRTAGRMRAKGDGTTLAGLDFGLATYIPARRPDTKAPYVEIVLQPGQEIGLLQEAAGACFVSIGGRVIEADPCPADDARFVVEARPRVEWWGFLRLSDGRSGWTLIARHGPAPE